MKTSASWTKGLNAGRKRLPVKSRSVSWHSDYVMVVLLSEDHRTFKLEMSPEEADSLSILLSEHAAKTRRAMRTVANAG